MALPKSSLAYTDCYEVYERAMESVEGEGPGVRVRLASWSDANYFRMRMNNARAINRQDNGEVYSPGDPLYKRSVWDALMVTIKQVDNEFYVYVEPHGIDVETIEEIPEGEVENVVTEKPEVPPPVGRVETLVTRR